MATIKERLGFANGPIILFKGNTYSHLEWFRQSVAKYRKYCGWYIPSTEEIPKDIPIDLETKELKWEEISENDEILLPDHIISEVIQDKLYDNSSSEYIGTIGDRDEWLITILEIRKIDSFYGPMTIYTMEDNNHNILVWMTSSTKYNLEKDYRYILVGTIKDHKRYQGIKQTYLSRCKFMEV